MQDIENSIGIVKSQKIEFNFDFEFENGVILPKFDLMIETYGKLNTDKSNAILICHALSGNHHVAGKYTKEDKYSGWWDNMVGPNKPIDTNKFFVVGINNLGGCDGSTGPISINPKTQEPYGEDFPWVTVKDWVKSQVFLSDYLGIERWAAIIGGSLGGMQALQWSIDYTARVKNVIVIAATVKLSAQNIAFNYVARQAIIKDPNFYQGGYLKHKKIPKQGLQIARMMGHITYLAEQGLGIKFGRDLKQGEYQFNYVEDFEVESYLKYQGDKFAEIFDANTYLLMTKALDYFDPAMSYQGDLARAFANTSTKFFIISFSSDWRFSPTRSKEIVEALVKVNKAVKYIEIISNYGHDAFLMQDKSYVDAMRSYLDLIYRECV